MAIARDIMTGGAECVGENETVVDAAREMRELDVGSRPICGEDQRLKSLQSGLRDLSMNGAGAQRALTGQTLRAALGSRTPDLRITSASLYQLS